MGMMQTDVKSKRLTVAGVVFNGRARLKGLIMSPAPGTACTYEFRDGGATGEILMQADNASDGLAQGIPYTLTIPGEGILFSKSIYLTFSVGSVTSITTFYG